MKIKDQLALTVHARLPCMLPPVVVRLHSAIHLTYLPRTMWALPLPRFSSLEMHFHGKPQSDTLLSSPLPPSLALSSLAAVLAAVDREIPSLYSLPHLNQMSIRRLELIEISLHLPWLIVPSVSCIPWSDLMCRGTTAEISAFWTACYPDSLYKSATFIPTCSN